MNKKGNILVYVVIVFVVLYLVRGAVGMAIYQYQSNAMQQEYEQNVERMRQESEEFVEKMRAQTQMQYEMQFQNAMKGN